MTLSAQRLHFSHFPSFRPASVDRLDKSEARSRHRRSLSSCVKRRTFFVDADDSRCIPPILALLFPSCIVIKRMNMRAPHFKTLLSQKHSLPCVNSNRRV
ncbi:hypothetical protein L596_000429 [Steinernema carpocapsae]|uniref:Uncharacterized protein n=1 Tax=Steinernema carpocapsae TaxID=34508 RepID=A0A4U8UI10_STECR|nr:hypothetical protein L596_000429 [Steinernema carpocapsae]